MKIGDTVYVLAKEDGTILGDGDGLVMSEVELIVKNELALNDKYLGALNQCDMSEVTVETVILTKV
jgi:hypothetical protein